MTSMRRLFSGATLVLALLGAGFVVPQDAAAQTKKKESQGPIVPDAARPGEEMEAKDEATEERRPITSKDFYIQGEGVGKYEALAAQKRQEAIEKLKQILDSGNVEGDQRAEMLLRLAELYYEESKDLYRQEMRLWDEAYGAWFDDPREDAEKGPEPKPDSAASKARVAQAVEVYREILRDYPKYARTDEVLFYLAFNLMDVGEDREALDKYKGLVKSFPQSAYVADGYLAIGEYYFDRNQAFKALNNYKKAASYENTNIYGFATYKLGWCYYNVGEYKDAIAAMKEVVANSQDLEAGKLSLKEDALKDLVLFFAESKDIEGAYEYFTRYADPKYYKASLKRLAAFYIEQSNFKQAIVTYRDLIAQDPLAKDAPSIQGKIIQAYFKQGKKSETLAAIEELVATYSPSTEWGRANASDPSSLKAANDLIEGQLIAVAVDYHKEARKTKSRKTYQAAYDSYKRYLELFPDAKDTYNIRFAFSEVKYDLKLYEEAAAEYRRVLEMDPKGKHLEIAASSWIVSVNKVLAKDENKITYPENKKVPATPLTKWEQEKVEGCETFAKLLPDHEDTPAILYEAGRIYYDHNNYAKAEPPFMELISRFTSHKNAEIAANLILDGYNQQENWAKVNEVARAFYANEELAKGDFKKDLKDYFQKASFLIVKDEEAKAVAKVKPDEDGVVILPKEDAARISSRYMAYYEEFPKSSVADVALNNSAVYAFQAGKVQSSIDSRERLLKEFPKSELKQKNLETLGGNYQSVADYATAATYFERLVESDSDRTYPGTADALYNAALYRENLGDWQQAIKHYEAYSKNYPDREDAKSVLLEIARIYEEQEDWAATDKMYLALINDKDSGFGPDRQLELYMKRGQAVRHKGDKAESYRIYREGVAQYEAFKAEGKELDAGTSYVAEMRFFLVEPLAEEFYKIQLELPEKLLLDRLRQKGQKLQEVEKAYVDVLALGIGEWGMAALHEVGMLYKALAESMLNSPIPPKLKGEQIAIYEAALADRAYPLLDKAAEAMEQCLSKSYELGIYNEYSSSAAALLAELRPKEYPPLAERIGEPDHMSEALVSAEFITNR